jgi:hypothetical protein
VKRGSDTWAALLGGCWAVMGWPRKEQCDFLFIQNHSNGFELIQ